MPGRTIAISSGHGKKIRGAAGSPVPPQLDEVNEARRVVAQVANDLRARNVTVRGPFNDDVSTSQSQNLDRIVNWHNDQSRDLDVSVHFNAYDGSAHGTECLYVSQADLAKQVSSAIAQAGHFTNRGAKHRGDLAFLNGTDEPAVLLEVCFCDNTSDSNLYNQHFAAICSAIATSISGVGASGPPPQQPPPIEQPPTQPDRPQPPLPPGQRPIVGKGDTGPYVVEVQQSLGLPNDGDFGPITEAGVMAFQRSWSVPGGADGVVGSNTWTALDELDRRMARGDSGLAKKLEDDIDKIAATAAINGYSWDDRGGAPKGYYSGMAKSFAVALQRFHLQDEAAAIMAAADSGDTDIDALAWYSDEFDDEDMDNSATGPDTLRHLFVMLIGLGMRESSGNHWCGRDMSASNVESDTAEGGLFQSSWNLNTASGTISKLLTEYENDPQGFLDTFDEGVNSSVANLDCYGSGDGAMHQWLSKFSPAYSVLMTAVGLRKRRQHWGPINRREVEIVSVADDFLTDVQRAVMQSRAQV